MKKLVVLGGGLNQIPLLEAGKKQGYQIALYDGKEDVPCIRYADEFHRVDISSSNAVIDVIKKFGADGIVCNTESLMPCLAEVQTSLGLVGNTKLSVENLSNKFVFRDLQKNAQVFSPNIIRASDYLSARKYIENVDLPQIIKPEKASGSRGVFVIHSRNELTKGLFAACSGCSRDGKVLIEDYIDFSNEIALEAEVFLIDGEIVYIGLFRTIRDIKKNLVPQCYCSSVMVNKKIISEITEQLQAVFKECGVNWGEYNIELSFNSRKELFIIEINPRQGGMMLPTFVRHFSGIDMHRLIVTTAVGDYDYAESIRENHKIVIEKMIHFRILVDLEGVYHGFKIDDEISNFLIDEFLYFQYGDTVHLGETGYSSIGTLDFDFSSVDDSKYKEIEKSIFNLIQVIID